MKAESETLGAKADADKPAFLDAASDDDDDGGAGEGGGYIGAGGVGEGEDYDSDEEVYAAAGREVGEKVCVYVCGWVDDGWWLMVVDGMALKLLVHLFWGLGGLSYRSMACFASSVGD